MNDPIIKQWLSQNDLLMDDLGRLVIQDEQVLSEINGAVGLLDALSNNTPCGAGCDSGCSGCDASDWL